MDDKQLRTDAIANVKGRLTQLTALLEPTIDHDFVMSSSQLTQRYSSATIANVRGQLTHLESLLETDDDHQMTSNDDFPDTTPGDSRDNSDTPLPNTRWPYLSDQNAPWHTRTIAIPTPAPSVISPAHHLDIETYADAVHRDNNTECCMSTFFNLAPATLPPAPHLSLLVLSTTHANMLFPGDSIGNALSPSSPFYSWMIFNRQDCFDGPLTNSMVSYRDLDTQNRPDLRLAYKPKLWARVSSPGCPPYIMQISSAWFKADQHSMSYRNTYSQS
jgi:hypothetical protein